MGWKNLSINLSLLKTRTYSPPNRGGEENYEDEPSPMIYLRSCKQCGNLYRRMSNYYNHHCWPKPVGNSPDVIKLKELNIVPSPNVIKLKDLNIVPAVKPKVPDLNPELVLQYTRLISDEMNYIGIKLPTPVVSPHIHVFYSVLNQFQKLFVQYRDKYGTVVICFYMCKFIGRYIDYLRGNNDYVYKRICDIVTELSRDHFYFGHFIGLQQKGKDVSLQDVFAKLYLSDLYI